MKKVNPFTGNFDVPQCDILFNLSNGTTHNSQILAGFKMLEDQGLIDIKSSKPCTTFRSSGNYEHNSIIEVRFDDKVIAYDTADGYQSIHRKDVFDNQLERLTFYFKRSYDASFHAQMKNSFKVKPLSLNYFCTCKGNPYDKLYDNEPSFSGILKKIQHSRNVKSQTYDYKIFESNNIKYDNYNLLFSTRLWDSSDISADSIQKIYPYFSSEQAKCEAEKWKDSLDCATVKRIEYIKQLKSHFGDKIIAGVSNDEFSRTTCPELILDDSVTNRLNFISLIKKNYICITSEGLHKSIGWKFAEYVAAGKAIITEPLAYDVPYGFENEKNYFIYSDTDSCINNCEKLLNDIDLVHCIEENNRNYYQQHLRPDKLILDSLNFVFSVNQ